MAVFEVTEHFFFLFYSVKPRYFSDFLFCIPLQKKALTPPQNNLRYADDTTLVAESEEELKSFLMKVKAESEEVGLKLNIQKTFSGNSVRLYFFGLQNHCRW